MKLFWVLALAMLRPLYFIYSIACLAAPFFILYCAACYFYPQLTAPNVVAHCLTEFTLGIAAILAIGIPLLVYHRKTPHDPNPFQSAFMSWYGTLRWSWNFVPGPMAKVALPSGYLVENPTSYRLNADDLRAILEKLKPGDILLRAYDGYLDGKFIRLSSLCSKHGYRKGWFTHAALFVGALDDNDRTHVPKNFSHDKKYFQGGPQMVLHSMAMGVHAEDILTWFRCDYMAVLRLNEDLTLLHKIDLPTAVKNKHRASDFASDQLKEALRSGTTVASTEAIQAAKMSALEKIGEPYDFECIETGKFHRFSCAEYVYFCYRCVHDALGLSPKLHALYPLGKLSRHFCLMGRNTITPDDFFRLAKEKHLELIWVDEISKKQL
jgi:hypothetical protein